jgi:hypothetical protein
MLFTDKIFGSYSDVNCRRQKFMKFATILPPVHDVGHKDGHRQLIRNDGQLCTNQVICYSNLSTSEVSGFRRGVDEIFALLRCYTACIGRPETTTNILCVNNPEEQRPEIPTGNNIRPQTLPLLV